MRSEPFLAPRLDGGRFQNHSIPLEFLKDLAVLEEMIFEIAKSKYLQDHPDRKRVPRGFTEGIELKLTGIGEGSAVANIDIVWESDELFPEAQTCLEGARDSVIGAISAAENDQNIGDYINEKSLAYFDRFGRNLREGEVIEFKSPNREKPARLTKETRRKLVFSSTAVNELTEEVLLRGTIPVANQAKLTFEIQMYDGHNVKAPMSLQHFEIIRDAWNGYRQNTRVLIKGVGKYNRLQKLQGLESIEHITILDPMDVPARLDELRLLKDGWLDGDGIAPKPEGLDWLAQAFDQYFPDQLPLPFVYPTAEGGVSVEWPIGTNEISLEIDLAKHKGELHRLNTQTNQEEMTEINLKEEPGWRTVAEKIKSIIRATA
jgi:hypothetical protein